MSDLEDLKLGCRVRRVREVGGEPSEQREGKVVMAPGRIDLVWYAAVQWDGERRHHPDLVRADRLEVVPPAGLTDAELLEAVLEALLGQRAVLVVQTTGRVVTTYAAP